MSDEKTIRIRPYLFVAGRTSAPPMEPGQIVHRGGSLREVDYIDLMFEEIIRIIDASDPDSNYRDLDFFRGFVWRVLEYRDGNLMSNFAAANILTIIWDQVIERLRVRGYRIEEEQKPD